VGVVGSLVHSSRVSIEMEGGEAVEVYRDVSLTWSKIATQAHDDASMKHELLIKVMQLLQ